MKLVGSDELKTMFIKKIDEYEKKGLIAKSDAEYSRKIDSINWIAKYILYNIHQLPDSHVIHSFWDNESDIFFNILNNDEFRPIKIEVDGKYNSFREIAQKTLSLVKLKNVNYH